MPASAAKTALDPPLARRVLRRGRRGPGRAARRRFARVRTSVVATILVVLVSGAPGVAAQPDGAYAPLSPGDRWVHHLNLTMKEGFDGIPMTRAHVVSVEPYAWEGTTIEVHRIESVTQFNFSGSSQTTEGIIWQRTSDGAALRSISFTNSSLGSEFGGRLVIDEVYDAPCADAEWPLVVNATWSVSCALSRTVTQDDREPQTTRAVRNTTGTVVNFTLVTTPAGPFEAFTIHRAVHDPAGLSGESVESYAPSACSKVRTETPDVVIELADFTCQRAAARIPLAPAPGPQAAAVVGALALAALALGRWRVR